MAEVALPGPWAWARSDAIVGVSPGDPVTSWPEKTGNLGTLTGHPSYPNRVLAYKENVVNDKSGVNQHPGNEWGMGGHIGNYGTLASPKGSGTSHTFVLVLESLFEYGSQATIWLEESGSSPSNWMKIDVFYDWEDEDGIWFALQIESHTAGSSRWGALGYVNLSYAQADGHIGLIIVLDESSGVKVYCNRQEPEDLSNSSYWDPPGTPAALDSDLLEITMSGDLALAETQVYLKSLNASERDVVWDYIDCYYYGENCEDPSPPLRLARRSDS